MSDLPPVTQYLCDAIDSAASNIETLTKPLEQAAAYITQALLSDHKVIVCGNSYCLPIASLLTSCLMNQLEFERPSLPAVNISNDLTTISSIAEDLNYHEIYAKQIRALGNEGDVLVALSINGNCSNVIQAIQAAHEKGIKVISIAGSEGGNIAALKHSGDIEVFLSSHSVARSMESQLIASNALCHLVETQLFGF